MDVKDERMREIDVNAIWAKIDADTFKYNQEHSSQDEFDIGGEG